jgi:glycosyltransferase involved in cell wall biosynthesis
MNLRGAKRVSLVLPNLGGGGAERVALTIAEDMLSAGHKVDLVLIGEGGVLLPLVPPNARIVELRATRIRNALVPLVRYFRQRKPDATQAFMWPVTALAVLAHRLAGTPGRLVVSDHTTLSQHYRHRGRFHGLLLKATVRMLYPLANARVMVSEVGADDLARTTGIDRSSLTIIYNPVVRPPEPISCADEAWHHEGVRVLSVGALKSSKNYSLLLEAFAAAAVEREAQLMILGDGPLRMELLQRAAELRIADRLIMPGFVLNPWPFYGSADLFVLSSDYEGYPLVLVEALLSGLNVVSTDCPSGPREILDDERYGRLAPVGDAERLARTIKEALARPLPPDLLRQRAEQLSKGSLEAYRRIMLAAAA